MVVVAAGASTSIHSVPLYQCGDVHYILTPHALTNGMQPTRPRGNSSGTVPVGVPIQSRPRTGSRRRASGRQMGWDGRGAEGWIWIEARWDE